MSAAILDVVGSRQVTVMPGIVAGDAASVALQLGCLRGFDEAGAIAERDGFVYAGVVADSGDPIEAIASEVASVVERPGRPLRIGHFNFRSPYLAIPRGASFTFDWPPYRAVRGPSASRFSRLFRGRAAARAPACGYPVVPSASAPRLQPSMSRARAFA
jgi:hypothetical protein